MRARVGVFVVILVSVIGFTSPASACDKCIDAGYNGWKKCDSGYNSGKTYCYGGFGEACTLGDPCGPAGGGAAGDDPFSPDFLVAVQPCLTCTGAEPDQGFVLRSEAAASEGLAKGSLPRSRRR